MPWRVPESGGFGRVFDDPVFFTAPTNIPFTVRGQVRSQALGQALKTRPEPRPLARAGVIQEFEAPAAGTPVSQTVALAFEALGIVAATTAPPYEAIQAVTSLRTSNVIRDTFTRTVSSNWGTADAGGTWTITPLASEASVDGSVGRYVSTVTNVLRQAIMAVNVPDLEATFLTKLDAMPTGASTAIYLYARTATSGPTDYYRFGTTVGTTGTVVVQISKNVASVFSTVTAVSSSRFTWAVGDWIRVRVQVIGSHLRMKVWKEGTVEPVAWDWDVTDTSLSATSTSNQIRLALAHTTGSTNTPGVSFEDVVVDRLAVGMPVEALAGVVATALDPFEALAAAEAQAASPWEAAGFAIATALAPWDAVQPIAASASDPYEALQSLVATAANPFEALGGLSQAVAAPWEAVSALALATALPYEALAALLATSSYPYEALARAVATGAVPWEALGGIAGAIAAPYEALGGIAVTVLAPWEATGGIVVAQTAVIPYEAVSALLGTATTPYEAVTSLARAATLPWEALTGGIAQTGALPFEALGGAGTVVVLPLEAAAGLVAVAIFPWESIDSGPAVVVLGYFAQPSPSGGAGRVRPRALVLASGSPRGGVGQGEPDAAEFAPPDPRKVLA